MELPISRIHSDATIRLPRSTGHTLLLATGFSGVLFILVFVILGVLAPGYNSLRQPIRQPCCRPRRSV